MKGSGYLGFRARKAGAKKWRYFNAPSFGHSGSARYNRASFGSWTRLSLNVSGLSAKGSDLELEVRAKKQTPLRLWIDEVVVE